ncbi:hypothetical protein AMTR_s00005p00259250 [Amborella trichopoda]|uniref:Uncharacterized protein n=2 Tax=Amborella trichopoda TaxID=13333 RepID=W1PII3_AMBTC|nr:hypothetical protein AMTR_s00005p00259250 [Amborella trichopoda]
MVGGLLSCGLTHAGVTPLDLLKCNMQANPSKYTSIKCGFNKLIRRHGPGALFKGLVPTFLGYSAQGAVKFGLYEFFKALYGGEGDGNSNGRHKTLVYLASSASAEFIADIALCPFEALKIRVQTHPDFAIGFFGAALDIVATQGIKGLYKGLLPLWGRQIPYTMVKFVCFEKTVEGIYKHGLSMSREECPKSVQLGVSFLAGYISGISCALVSQPADNLVSLINNCKGETLSTAIAKVSIASLFTRGLTLRILMVGTLTGAQWGIYDAFKVINGLPPSGTMPSNSDSSKLGSALSDSLAA